MGRSANKNSQRGFTLVELVIGMSIAVLATGLGGLMMRDYLATARTLRVQTNGNIEMTAMLRNITREFQTSRSYRRACVLRATGASADPTTAAPDLTDYECRSGNTFEPTDGIGFDVDPDTNTPKRAFINSCVPFLPADLPRGRGGSHQPLESPVNLSWGGASSTCPAECPADHRPVVRYLKDTGVVEQRTVPKADGGSKALELWGAVICASEFLDVRDMQGLKARDFMAQYINILAFVGRGRFDTKFPKVPDSKGVLKPQSYVWMTGGIVLDFLDAQEMAIFKCKAGDPDC